MGSRTQMIVAVTLAVVSGIFGLSLGMTSRSDPVALPPLVDNLEMESIDVHVSGWVVDPGVVTLPRGSIAAEAIELSGGLRAGADLSSVNLAAEVFAGEQIVVLGPGVADAGPEVDGVLSLNRATLSQLEALPGVGPVLAQRIVDQRDRVGRFESVEDLLEVAGIGEAKLASLRDHVRP